MRHWGPRRWLAAGLASLASLLVLGLPTDLVPNPVFGRQIAAPTWSYVALVVTSVLAGLVLATYVRDAVPTGTSGPTVSADAVERRRVTLGGLLSFLAIGCPTCNKLVVVALGSSGALTWFEPLQPALAVAGIVLLGVALRRRLEGEVRCAVSGSPG